MTVEPLSSLPGSGAMWTALNSTLLKAAQTGRVSTGSDNQPCSLPSRIMLDFKGDVVVGDVIVVVSMCFLLARLKAAKSTMVAGQKSCCCLATGNKARAWFADPPQITTLPTS
jgi:hypothetical protein